MPITNNYISLNGTQFRPTSVDVEETKIGEEKRMADGTLKFYHRAVKLQWTIAWTGLVETAVAAIRTIYRLTTSFTFIDEFGTSWTVLTLPGNLQLSMSAEKTRIDGTKYYDVELVVTQV